MSTPDPKPPCPVCAAESAQLDVVDFNKSCLEASGTHLPASGIPIRYALCPACGFCFAPGMAAWSLGEFESRVYNDDYVLVDPEYVETRPRAKAASLIAHFPGSAGAIRHLDYGGGEGLVSRLLREAGWNSVSWDPFVDKSTGTGHLGRFDLITAFEVFEHVPDVHALVAALRSLLAPDGIVLFSTLLSDGHIRMGERLTWWYASPRNGHISLFSKRSLAVVAKSHGFDVATSSDNQHHIFWTTPPPWAARLGLPGSPRPPPG